MNPGNFNVTGAFSDNWVYLVVAAIVIILMATVVLSPIANDEDDA